MIDSNKGMIEVNCYIHLNLLRAKIVEKPESYPWSSYSYYNGIAICPYTYMDRNVMFFK